MGLMLESKSISKPKGWLRAEPLQHYSSLNKLSFFDLIHWPFSWPKKEFYIQFSFNLHIPLKIDPRSYLTFYMQDAALSSGKGCCYTITDLTRYRLDISSFDTLEDFLSNINSHRRNNYKKSKKTFSNYGASISYVEGNWTSYVPEVYALYANLASRHGNWLYDLHFFEDAARREDYKLLCAWYEGEMIGVSVIQEERKTLHAVCGGFDYHHSSKASAYSWLNFSLIEKAIQNGSYDNVDVGITADESKHAIGYQSIASKIDVYSKGPFTRLFLKFFSLFVKATISSDAKLKFRLF